MAPTLLRPHRRDPKLAELPAMIAAVLNLLEDQHILHGESQSVLCGQKISADVDLVAVTEIPLELARIVHIDLPVHAKKDPRSLLQKLEAIF
jgi:hypothetical protein